jgi:hypothetical protein
LALLINPNGQGATLLCACNLLAWWQATIKEQKLDHISSPAATVAEARCSPRPSANGVTRLGDAIHPMLANPGLTCQMATAANPATISRGILR